MIQKSEKKQENRNASIVLGVTIFIMGGCGLAYEYTFSKISSDVLGNSTQQWAIIIGVMMFFMGIGSDLQKRFNDDGLADKLVFVEVLLGLLGGFGALIMLYTYGHSPENFAIIQYGLIGSVGMIIGFEIPLIARINQAYTKDLGINLGSILKMDYIGSLCGALLWIFFLPRYFTLIESAFVLGIATLITAAFTAFYFRSLIHATFKLWIFIISGLIALILGYTQAKDWTLFAEQYLYADRIILSETTKFQHIILTESSRGEVFCYINGHLQFNSFTEHIYHENLVHPAMAIAPRRNKVLILGGGDGLAMREVLKYKDVEEVTLVDIDPEMTRLAKENQYFAPLNEYSLSDSRVKYVENGALVEGEVEDIYEVDQSDRFVRTTGKTATVTVLNIDAVNYVEQVPGYFDVIILDFPDPNSPELAKLYSERFYQHMKGKLNPQGIFVQQSTSPYHAKETFLCIGRTIEKSGLVAVPYHDNVPAFGEWGWWIGGRDDFYQRDAISDKMEAIDRIFVKTRYITPALIKASTEWGKDVLATTYNDTTTISSPKAFEYYLDAWKSAM